MSDVGANVVPAWGSTVGGWCSFGGLLGLIGVATLVFRDADVVGIPAAGIGGGFLLLGAGVVGIGLVRRARWKRKVARGEPVLALVYLVSPIDVLPELLPIIGVADDAGVAVWLMTSLAAAALVVRSTSPAKLVTTE